jgi:hypothetical protein
VRSDFEGSCFQAVVCLSAFIRHTSFARCDISGSLLLGTLFESVNLEAANLDRAILGAGALAKLDLSTAEGLSGVTHQQPTSVGLDTIVSSGGRIPHDFLRGCGIDPLIQTVLTGDPASRTEAFTHWLAKGPSIFERCFISYATADQQFVDRLQRELNSIGVDYWYAPVHGRWGAELEIQIQREISLRDRMLLVCSRASLASDWVIHEIETAIDTESKRGKRVIFPVLIDDALFSWRHRYATRIKDVLAADFRNATKGKAFRDPFNRLVDALRTSGVSNPR